MTDQPGVVVTGVSGRMGQMLVRELAGHPHLQLVGALSEKGHDWIGRDLGDRRGTRTTLGVTV
jgi:4-hydroxy-tetrahydrodipicolinate reductase